MSAGNSGAGILAWTTKRSNELRLAVMFLTRFPVGRIDPLPLMADAVWAYPIAGALHGLTIGLVYASALGLGFSNFIAALLAVAVGIFATGAFHEDGLADCADGFGGGMTRARKLDIMRDSRIGTYGTVALILALGLRVGLISEFKSAAQAIGALVGLGALTRAMLPVALWTLPAAREDGMTADTADSLPGKTVVVVALAVGLLATLVLVPHAMIAIPAVAAGMAFVYWFALRQINGLTGDVLGASQVIGELCGLLAITAVAASIRA